MTISISSRVPTWAVLKKITNSLVGKCILIISVGIPITKLSAWGLSLPSINLTVFGALLTLLSWTIAVLSMPSRIRENESADDFATTTLTRYCKKAMNPAVELMWISNYSSATDAAIRCNLPDNFIRRFPLAESLNTSQSPESTIYYYSLIAYECDNISGIFLRTVASVIALIGVVLLYNSAISGSLAILFEVLHVN